MYNFQGILAKAVNNSLVQFETLGYLTTDISNLHTNAFKSQRFENVLNEYGRLEGSVRTDVQTGSIATTQRPLDVAIKGAGYIPVTQKNGSVGYTRDGSFCLNADGLMVTNSGAIVGDGIKVPTNYDKILIGKDGTVSITPKNGDEKQVIGKIPLVQFNNPEGLKILDGNVYEPTKDSGSPKLLKNHDYMVQGSIEKSNVNFFGTVNEVMQLNASMIMSTGVMKVVDDMYTKAINIRE